MNREARLASAKTWLKSYSGRDVVRGYRKWYGVSSVCAVIELELLGISVPSGRLEQAKFTEQAIARQRRERKEAVDQEQVSSDWDGVYAFIAGYTSAGFPYGITWEELASDTEWSEAVKSGI